MTFVYRVDGKFFVSDVVWDDNTDLWASWPGDLAAGPVEIRRAIAEQAGFVMREDR